MKFNDLNEFWKGIIIAFATLVVAKLVDYFLERKRVRREGNRWMSEVLFMLHPIKRQMGAIDEFLEEFAVDKFETPTISTFVHLSDGGLQSLNKSDLQQFLFRKYLQLNPLPNMYKENGEKALALCNHIHGNIIINQRIFHRIEEIFNSYQDNASVQVSIFKNNLHEFQWKFADVFAEAEKAKIDIDKDTFLKPLTILITKEVNKFVPTPGAAVSRKNSMELFKFQNDFILPAFHIMALNRMDPRVAQINKHLNRCNAAITEIRLEKSYLTTNISNVKKRLKQLDTDTRKDLEDTHNLCIVRKLFRPEKLSKDLKWSKKKS